MVLVNFEPCDTTEQNLVSILYDIFWAGSDTSSSTISYAILWLTIHPHVQQKLRNELKEFVKANNREPTVHDKNEYVDHEQNPN